MISYKEGEKSCQTFLNIKKRGSRYKSRHRPPPPTRSFKPSTLQKVPPPFEVRRCRRVPSAPPLRRRWYHRRH